jgi:hypothetical protein
MDKPLAFKEQEGLTSSFSEVGAGLSGVLCPTIYRCPNCRKVYKVVLGPGSAFLGEGERTCLKCKTEFRDRSEEWPLLDALDRFFFVCPGIVCGWMLLGIVVGVVFYWAGWVVGENVPLLLPVALIFVTPLMAWFVFRGCQVARSIHRFNLHGKARVA